MSRLKATPASASGQLPGQPGTGEHQGTLAEHQCQSQTKRAAGRRHISKKRNERVFGRFPLATVPSATHDLLRCRSPLRRQHSPSGGMG